MGKPQLTWVQKCAILLHCQVRSISGLKAIIKEAQSWVSPKLNLCKSPSCKTILWINHHENEIMKYVNLNGYQRKNL